MCEINIDYFHFVDHLLFRLLSLIFLRDGSATTFFIGQTLQLKKTGDLDLDLQVQIGL